MKPGHQNCAMWSNQPLTCCADVKTRPVIRPYCGPAREQILLPVVNKLLMPPV